MFSFEFSIYLYTFKNFLSRDSKKQIEGISFLVFSIFERIEVVGCDCVSVSWW